MAAPNRPELNQELNLIISQTVCENFLLQVVLCELHNGVVCFSSSTVTLQLFGSKGNPAQQTLLLRLLVRSEARLLVRSEARLLVRIIKDLKPDFS